MAISGKYYMIIFYFPGMVIAYFRFQDLMEKESVSPRESVKSGKILCWPLLVIPAIRSSANEVRIASIRIYMKK